MANYTKTAPEIRFWRKVQKGTSEQCWPWIGDKSHHGYGRFYPNPNGRKPNGKKFSSQLAHRMSWLYTFGELPPKPIEICHRCDNPPCCNPDHLFAATHKENMADCKSKGRLNSVRGERQGHAKLTEKQVVQIRQMYKPGVVSYRMVAKLFGVTRRAIMFIIHRKNWKHVP